MVHVTWSHLVFMALLEMLFHLTDGSNITWLEPPPVETVTDASRISMTTKQVIKGSLNEELSCNFSLTSDMDTRIVSVKVGEQPAVNVYVLQPNVSVWVEPNFAKTFNVVWVPNKLVLIFFNITDAEEAEYLCEVITVGRSARHWTRKIQLVVLDPSPAMVSFITVPQNLIQTIVSATTASEDPRQTMVSSITGSHIGPIPTMESAITASKVGNPRDIIGSVLGVVAFLIIAIAIGCYLKRRMRSKKVRRDNQQGNEDALLGPLAADGINGNQSNRVIQGKEEDTPV